jgi:hypothetical protein
MGTRYHGGKAVIQMGIGAGAVAAAASLSQWSLDKATDKVDVTCFGDPNKQYVQGLPDIKGSLAGFFDSANDALFDGAESSTGVSLYLYPSSLLPLQYHYGPAWLDASISVDVKGAVAVKASFVANGAWGRLGLP